MLNKPRFKHNFHLERVESEGIFLLSENTSFLLHDRLSQLLVSLIDGKHTVDEIVVQLQEQASATELYYALMRMEQKGYIVESNDEQSPAITAWTAFWDQLNVDSNQAVVRLQTTQITVHSFGNIIAKPLTSLLESLQIKITDQGDLDVVLTDDYLQAELEIFNQNALTAKRPWMLIKPVGTTIWIGPIFQPGETGCWECLAQRLRANRPVETFIQKRKPITTPFLTSLSQFPSILQTAFNLAATEIIKWIVQAKNQKLEGTLITLDTLSLETQQHILVKRPQCSCCGNPIPPSEPSPVILNHQKKTFSIDGGHRYVSSEETFKKYQHHISPITGIVRGLRALFKTDNGLVYSYVAGHHFTTLFDELYFLRENVRGRSGGKGKTEIQAKASGLCEAIERYSGIFQGNEIRQKSSYYALREVAIHPNTCMNFSQTQYQTRHEWNANCEGYFQKIPEPFDEEREIDWTPVWSLTHQTFKYLPTAYCYYGYPTPYQPDCWADSNGSAAGNTKEEAILQGLMELIERDSVALWWYNRLKRPSVNLDSFNEPYFQILKDYYQTLHRELWVLDITNDFNIPTFAAISRRTDKKIEDILLGFGTHFDPKIALLRALTEVNQSLPAVLSMDDKGNTQYPTEQPDVVWWKTATLNNQPYLVPDVNTTAKEYFDFKQPKSDDIREEVMNCVNFVAQQGIEVLVLDQTRPDIGLHVIKVIAPGMRHFWKRLGPGRLYQVPIKLGWLPEPLIEEQLNPIPVFF